jgi:hypothetical protein
MKKGMFYRKCLNIAEYDKLLKIYKEYFCALEYQIIKTIKLSVEDFIVFTNDFLKPQNFIFKNINKMKMDQNDSVSCLFITCDSFNYGILVYSAGYNYARYVAKLYK